MLIALATLALEPIFHLVGYLSGRWPNVWFAAALAGTVLQILLLFAGAIHDRLKYRRIHPVSLWVPVLLIAWVAVLALVVAPSAAWGAFATWLVS
jgi:hypothetical protein